ncbi:MAG: radical SAM protein [Alphaproteobacteria bacterium]|nr:radical SAM protein [Alphaproteobacteria bacterium]
MTKPQEEVTVSWVDETTGRDYARLVHVSRLAQLSVELSTSCNLACVYCHFAPLDRRGNDMAVDTIERVIEFCTSFPVDIVTLSGDAEITMFKGWETVAKRLLDAGVNLRTICNFTNGIFSEEQVDAFSRFTEILVSLDTADAHLLKKTRYRADLRTITLNVTAIRAKCILDDRPQPNFICNTVVSDKNLPVLDKLTAFAIAAGFNMISLQRLVGVEEVEGGKNDFFDNPNAIPVFPLHAMEKDAAHAGLTALQRAMKLAEGRIEFSMHPAISGELGRLIDYINGIIETAAPPSVTPVPVNEIGARGDDGQTLSAPKRTKACLMPWNFMHVMWTGEIPPCCIVKDQFVGKTDDAPLAGIFNSDEMKQYRMGLLSGNMPDVCKTCTYMPDTDVDALSVAVESHLRQTGQTL